MQGILDQIWAIDWTQPTWDLFIILFFIVAAFLYGLSLGRDRIIMILVSIYMALAVVSSIPYFNSFEHIITINQAFAFKITTFLGLFVILFFLLSRSALLRVFGEGSRGSWWQVLIFSFLHVGLLISIVLSLVPGQITDNLAPLTKQVFITEQARFVWIILPIIGMAFIKRKEE